MALDQFKLSIRVISILQNNLIANKAAKKEEHRCMNVYA